MQLTDGKSNSNCDRVESKKQRERERQRLESIKDFQKGIWKRV